MENRYQERLAKAMEQSGVTVTRLASLMGVSYQAVKQVASGKANAFNASNNVRAAKALGVNPEWLATGDGSMSGDDASREVSAQGDLAQELSPSAIELGRLFDLITDRVQRAVAYNAATAAILDVLQGKNRQSD